MAGLERDRPVDDELTGQPTDRAPPALRGGRSAQPPLGTCLAGRWILGERLGRGGMGSVFRAEDTELGEEVALKLLSANRVDDPRMLERFRREVKLTRRINHPNVCRVFDLGEASGQRFLTMELVEGTNLRRRIAEDSLELAEKVQILTDVAAALAAAHEIGVVHRDLKPENVMVRPDGRAVVVDFGLARSRDGGSVTVVGGTPTYMAPEQLRGLPFDERADVFAFGILAFELLTGALPFDGSSDEAITHAILHDRPRSLDTPDLPHATRLALEHAIHCALAKDPGARPTSVKELAFAIAASIAPGTPSPRVRPRIGDVVGGKYRLERVLGEGGMGRVFAGTHVHLDEPVAIKLLLPRFARDERMVSRFLREARAAAKIKSPHVVRVTDVDATSGGAPYLVMEYLEGSTLSDIIRTRGRLQVDEAVEYLAQACEAVAEAHARGIVHRDLKPSNLFLTRGRDGAAHVKVLDFGISKLLDRATLTATAELIGSPKYMSPEQLLSSRDVDARTDVWALGAILYLLVSGVPPFDAPNLVELADAVTRPPVPLRSHRPDVSDAVVKAVERCLQQDAAARFVDASELLAELQALRARATPRTSVVVTTIGTVAHARLEDATTFVDAGNATTVPQSRGLPRRKRLWVWPLTAAAATVLAGGWLAVRGLGSSPLVARAATFEAPTVAAPAPPAAEPAPPAEATAAVTVEPPAPASATRVAPPAPAPKPRRTAPAAGRPAPPAAEEDPFGGSRR